LEPDPIRRVFREYPDLVPEREDFLKGTVKISRHTVSHPEYGFVPGTIGEGAVLFLLSYMA
jgi:hypothetical protein